MHAQTQTLIFICYYTGLCLSANIFHSFVIEVEIHLHGNTKPYLVKKMKSQKTYVDILGSN